MAEELALVHRPKRPEWFCEVDGRSWPCDSAKRELRKHFYGRGIAFGAYLTERAQEAYGDLSHIPEDDLLRRFVLWPGREGQHEPGD